MHDDHGAPSGEVLLVGMGVAVYLTVAVICAAAFLPAGAGVIVALGMVVLVAAGVAGCFSHLTGSSRH